MFKEELNKIESRYQEDLQDLLEKVLEATDALAEEYYSSNSDTILANQIEDNREIANEINSKLKGSVTGCKAFDEILEKYRG